MQLDQCRFTQFPQGSLAYRGHKQIGSAENAFQLSQRYALERFGEACASRGAVPPPYNGSIFTMDMPAGVMGFNGPKNGPTSPDGRDWAILSFMWQNTRHPYWAMAARGDYDTLLPGMQFVRDGLDVCRDRCRNIFHHDGAFIMEASWWHNVGVFDWNGVPQHLRYHFLATIELPAIMCEYYEHTQDRKFLDEILLPCADEFIKFYELQFPRRDARGKMVMEPAATVETYQPVTIPTRRSAACGTSCKLTASTSRSSAPAQSALAEAAERNAGRADAPDQGPRPAGRRREIRPGPRDLRKPRDVFGLSVPPGVAGQRPIAGHRAAVVPPAHRQPRRHGGRPSGRNRRLAGRAGAGGLSRPGPRSGPADEHQFQRPVHSLDRER